MIRLGDLKSFLTLRIFKNSVFVFVFFYYLYLEILEKGRGGDSLVEMDVKVRALRQREHCF